MSSEMYFSNYLFCKLLYTYICLVVQRNNVNQTYIVHILTWCILGVFKNAAYQKLIVSIIIRFNSKLSVIHRTHTVVIVIYAYMSTMAWCTCVVFYTLLYGYSACVSLWSDRYFALVHVKNRVTIIVDEP